MKLTLIAGIDGSGKSTFLDFIQKTANSNSYRVINCPSFDNNNINSEWNIIGNNLQKLQNYADANNHPVIKVSAMFLALSFLPIAIKDLSKNTNSINTIFIERHPVFDIKLFGPIYLDWFSKGIQSINSKFSDELSLMVSNEDIELIQIYLKRVFSIELDQLPNFIFTNLSKPEHYDWETLCQLFHTPLPDEIVYLDYSSKIATQDVLKREVREYHENAVGLGFLESRYSLLFEEVIKFGVNIVNIPAHGRLEDMFELAIKNQG